MHGDPPLDLDEFRRWRGEAARALRSAELQAGEGLDNWACFSAEQSAQLSVKGFLHGLGRAPWGHDLDHLGRMASEAGVELPEAVSDAMHRLTRHYIPSRYPDAHPGGEPADHYGAGDAEQAIADARAIGDFVDREWERARGDQSD